MTNQDPPSNETAEKLAIETAVSIKLAIALHRRLARLLNIVFSGDFFFPHEKLEVLYVSMRIPFLKLLDETDYFSGMVTNFEHAALPVSLFSMGEDCEEEWEFTIHPALKANTAEILSLCVESGINPFHDEETDAVLKGYDESINAYESYKKEQTAAAWERVNRHLHEQKSRQQESREATSSIAAQKQVNTRGPTLNTKERASLYKRLKDEHPNWSQAKVALEANRTEQAETHSEETVRNTYRAMGWKWDRSDRIR